MAARNPTNRPIVCPECGHEIEPDESARLDVIAALDYYKAALLDRTGAISSDRKVARARLLALLGIADR